MQFDFDIFTLFVGVAATTTLAVNELRVLLKAATLPRPANKNVKLLKLFLFRWLWNSPVLSDLYCVIVQAPATGFKLIYTFLWGFAFELNMTSLHYVDLAKTAGTAWCYVFGCYVVFEKVFYSHQVQFVKEQRLEEEALVDAVLASN